MHEITLPGAAATWGWPMMAGGGDRSMSFIFICFFSAFILAFFFITPIPVSFKCFTTIWSFQKGNRRSFRLCNYYWWRVKCEKAFIIRIDFFLKNHSLPFCCWRTFLLDVWHRDIIPSSVIPRVSRSSVSSAFILRFLWRFKSSWKSSSVTSSKGLALLPLSMSVK